MKFSLYEQIFTRFAVNKETHCWEWTSTLTNDGYPEITSEGKTYLVHRKMCEFYWGPIPAAHHVHHECHTRSCISPAHLRAVPPREDVALRRDFIHQRADRLACLVERHEKELLFPGRRFESTYLASLWQCRSHDVPRILATMAFTYPGFHYIHVRSGKRGRKPSLFQIYVESSLLEGMDNMPPFKKLAGIDRLVITV